MNSISKLFIGIGVILIALGLVWQVGGKYFNLGRLPGDIVIERDSFRFYFPIVTSLVLSAVISIVLFLIRFFNKP